MRDVQKNKMGHIAQSYKDLQKRLDRHAQGAPESETLYKILEILFTEEEAKYVSKLPIRFFTIEEASFRLKKDYSITEKILDTLAEKGILFDFEKGKIRAFALAPTMAGFFEFSLMRTDGKFDREILSELFYQYINQEKKFITRIFGMTTPIDRTFVHEDKIQAKDISAVLDYEKASHVIESASQITVSECYCRHKMEHMGKACNMPNEVCLSFNKAAETLAKHKIAKEISKEQAMKILKDCRELGLVQIGDNVQEGVNWICNCCGCCCEALIAYKKLGYKRKIHSNFFAHIDDGKCRSCGICIAKCPVDAIQNKNDRILIDTDKCIGCGVCSHFCPQNCIVLERKKKINYVPKDSFERIVINAIEEGKLQNYIFDNYDSWTSELLRELFGVILKLTPKKILMAQKQIKSKYLEALVNTKYYKLFDILYNEGKKQNYSHPELK